MSRRVRSVLAGAAAAAFLSAQVAHAAPVPSIDPLVALSAFGTAQSQSAVCAAGASAAAAGAATASQAPGTNCVLPVTGAPAPVAQAPVGPAYVAPVPGAVGIGALPMLLGLAALIGLAALLASGGDDGSGNLTPISPN